MHHFRVFLPTLLLNVVVPEPILYATSCTYGPPSRCDLHVIGPDDGRVVEEIGRVALVNDDSSVLPDWGMCYSNKDDMLYAIGDSDLYRIDPATAAATLVSSVPSWEWVGLACGPDGTLYSYSGYWSSLHPSRVVAIDPSSGRPDHLLPIDAPMLSGTLSLSYDDTLDVLWAMSPILSNQAMAYKIDPATGKTTSDAVVISGVVSYGVTTPGLAMNGSIKPGTSTMYLPFNGWNHMQLVRLGALVAGKSFETRSGLEYRTFAWAGEAVVGGTVQGSCRGRDGTPMTSSIVRMSRLAAKLSSLVYDIDAANGYKRKINLYREEPDVVLTAKIGNLCITAFRGTENRLEGEKFEEEWKQNIDDDPILVADESKSNVVDRPEPGDDDDDDDACYGSEGFLNAFLRFRNGVSRDMKICRSSCRKRPCNVVLTGHSQGGAIANIAGIVLRGLNPLVITFGQPPALSGGCGRYLRSDRWFRYILAMPEFPLISDDAAGLTYDIVPMGAHAVLGDRPTGKFFGHEIVLSSDDSTSVNYIGRDVHQDIRPWDISLDAHSMVIYHDVVVKLDKTRKRTKCPIRSNGFEGGARCTLDTECASGCCKTKGKVKKCMFQCIPTHGA